MSLRKKLSNNGIFIHIAVLEKFNVDEKARETKFELPNLSQGF